MRFDPTRLKQLGLSLMLVCLASAWAHPSGVTITDLYIGAERVELVYTVPTNDLWRIEDGERPAEPRPADHYQLRISEGFTVTAGEQPCKVTSRAATQLTEVDSYEFRLKYQCPRPLTDLSLDYALFVDFDRGHRNLVRLYIDDLGRQTVLHSQRRQLTVPVARVLREQNAELVALADKPEPEAVTAMSFGSFFRLGIEHIIGGYDHLLFLAGLLLLAQRLSTAAVWVTAFTVAHSITLSLAVLGVFDLPVLLTESLIALSVAWVGALNLKWLHHDAAAQPAAWRSMPRLPPGTGGLVWRRWWLTFLFGLVHGLGFAAMLREIGLSDSNRLASLAGFNLGVEAGQLAVVILAVPLLRWIARRPGYPVVASGASAGLVVVGLVWFGSRLVGGWV